MQITLPSVTEDLRDFFTYVWGTTHSGWTYLPTEIGGAWQGFYFPWPKARDNVVEHVIAKAGTGHNVFFSPAIFTRPRGTRDSVLGARCLWVDFDGNAPKEWTRDDVPTPTLRVQSSIPGHEHVYWRLKEFIEDPDLLEDRNRALAYFLGADSSGWDANQILRPPHTTNRKRMLPVTIEKWDR